MLRASTTARAIPTSSTGRHAMQARLNVLCCVLTALAVPALAQESYPGRTVRMIVSTAAGAANDLQARTIAQELSTRWGRPVVVENRVGAGTVIGNDVVAKAAPDGYTLLMTVSALAIGPATYKKIPYDVIRDFAPVTQTVMLPNVMVLHPSVPARSVKQFIALAKSRPGEILFASSGVGTNAHLAMEHFASMAQIRLTHVPYKGGTASDTALVGGEVAIKAASVSQAMTYVRTGRLRALGVTSLHRLASEPDMPTIAEAGLPGYEAVAWHALLAPAKTPRPIVDKLYSDVGAVLRSPAIKQHFSNEGSEVVASTPEEFGEFLKAEVIKWAKVAKAAGLHPE
ncbi:MAG: tripartite tricarboxylate transporter substrate binding protein [Burkholderiales bacterium]